MNALPKTSTGRNLMSGAAGAVFLNVLHESARKALPDAPHVDAIGMRALGKPLQKIGRAPSSLRTLRRMTLAGDLAANTLYYSWAIAGSKDRTSLWKRTIAFGALAGVGAVALPPVMGLGQQFSRRFAVTATLTVAWYLSAALVAAAASQRINKRT